MIEDIVKIAIACIVFGGASIPLSFTINSSPIVVWVGNALGSLLSALFVIYIGNRITNKKEEEKLAKKKIYQKNCHSV